MNRVITALRDDEAAEAVAKRLRALAEDLREQPWGAGCAAIAVDAFLAAARALESASDPPPRHQLLALVQVLTAGFATLTSDVDRARLAANDCA